MMGDHFGYSLMSCAKKGAQRVVLAGQFAKLVKIACGHQQTHVSSSELDLAKVAQWLRENPATAHLEQTARQANTARHLLEASGYDNEVCTRQLLFAQTRVAFEYSGGLSGFHGGMALDVTAATS